MSNVEASHLEEIDEPERVGYSLGAAAATLEKAGIETAAAAALLPLRIAFGARLEFTREGDEGAPECKIVQFVTVEALKGERWEEARPYFGDTFPDPAEERMAEQAWVALLRQSLRQRVADYVSKMEDSEDVLFDSLEDR